MDLNVDFSPEVIAFTQELVRSNSLSGHESGVAEKVAAKMRSLDFDDVIVDQYGSVVGIRESKQPGRRVMFDAHMDVVPVKNPGDWSEDPFSGALRGNKVYGRGATDIKGGLAAMVVALGRLPRSQFAGTLIASASVGEETIEGAAVQQVVERTHPDGAVIIEPTECRIGIGHKGRTRLWFELRGKPAHASSPHLGVNAVYRAVEVIQRMRTLVLPQDAVLGSGVMELIEIRSSPFPGESTVPYGCTLGFDRRLVRGETPNSVRTAIEQALSDLKGWSLRFNRSSYETYTGMTVERDEFHPGWVLPASNPWVQTALQGLHTGSLQDEVYAAPFCTNGSFTAGVKGLPSVIFGPSTIALAHGIDEYIEVEELEKAVNGFAGLAGQLGQALT